MSAPRESRQRRALESHLRTALVALGVGALAPVLSMVVLSVAWNGLPSAAGLFGVTERIDQVLSVAPAVIVPLSMLLIARPLLAVSAAWACRVFRVGAWALLGAGIAGLIAIAIELPDTVRIVRVARFEFLCMNQGGFVHVGAMVLTAAGAALTGAGTTIVARRARRRSLFVCVGVLGMWALGALLQISIDVYWLSLGTPSPRDWQVLYQLRAAAAWSWAGLGLITAWACIVAWRATPLLFEGPRDGLCVRCRYDLRGQREPGCPECGWGRGDGEGMEARRHIPPLGTEGDT